MSGWLPIVLSVLGLAGGLVGALVSLRKLPAERGLTEAQREQTMVETAAEAARLVREDLGDCRDECKALRKRMTQMEEHIRGLERLLRDNGLPVPVLPYGGI